MSPKWNRFWNLIEFSLHSLFQAYGHMFVKHVVLRHPLRTLRGLWAYLHLGNTAPAIARQLSRGGEQAFVQRAAGDKGRLLVGTGFCQKPSRAAGSAHDCPSGRFTHDCLYLSRLELGRGSERPFHPACADCSIRLLGNAALNAGASFAVLTSARDIAQDILLPALEEQRYTYALLALCPYSVEPMSLALLICGVEGYLFHYCSGSCVNYRQWLRADKGDKPERTALSPQAMDTMLRILGSVEMLGKQTLPR